MRAKSGEAVESNMPHQKRIMQTDWGSKREADYDDADGHDDDGADDVAVCANICDECTHSMLTTILGV